MKRNLLLSVIILAFVVVPVWALAGTVEGTIQGFNCVTYGKVCPVGQEDPLIATEKIFVVFTKDKSHYFVPNLDRAILARHINQPVRVTGDISSKYPSIQAEKLEVLKDGSWKTAWSLKMQKEISIPYTW